MFHFGLFQPEENIEDPSLISTFEGRVKFPPSSARKRNTTPTRESSVKRPRTVAQSSASTTSRRGRTPTRGNPNLPATPKSSKESRKSVVLVTPPGVSGRRTNNSAAASLNFYEDDLENFDAVYERTYAYKEVVDESSGGRFISLVIYKVVQMLLFCYFFLGSAQIAQ